MRRFFISPEQIEKEHPILEGRDAKHIRTVLRLAAGEEIIVFDGQGREYVARIAAIDRRQVDLDLIRPLAVQSESLLPIAFAQGYLKDKKMDLLVRQLTEIGITRLVPFMARRSVPSPDAQRQSARQQRWHTISQEAVKQCRRARPMTIDPVLSFEQALAAAEPFDLKLFFWESGGTPLVSGDRPKPGSVFLMVGPEGGFSEEEQRAACRRGFIVAQLGPRILKAETAAVAAAVLVQFLFGDLNQNMLDNP